VTSAADARSDLRRLAELYGVQTSYAGADDREHPADDETLLALVRLLGAPVEGADDVPGALAATVAGRAGQPIEPVLVHWVGRTRPATVVLPRSVAPGDGWLTIELEDGSVHRERLSTAIARPVDGTTVDGRRFDTYQLRLGAPGTPVLPPGYHRVVLEFPGAVCESLLLSAGRCPPPERAWGAFLPLYALRTDDDRGIGTYRDLAELGRFVGGLGGGFVGTLPLHPAFLTAPADPSPYRPVTRLGWNEVYVDPSVLPEVEISAEARAVLASAGYREQVDQARRSARVDYPKVLDAVNAVLAPLARALFAGPSARRDDLEAFVAARPDVAAYARFRAACDSLGRPWSSWPGARPGTVPPDAADPRLAEVYLYGQWAATQQLAAAAGGGAGLYLDFPVGVHPDGFDPWWAPESFCTGARGGAPPDAFNAAGQDWGIPPLHPEGARRSGYRYLVAALRHAMAQCSVLRVDHVMGLHRLYWIPSDNDATDGAYVRYHADELRAVIDIEAARASVAVVGEDLGTVPAEVREAMARDGMLRSWVLQFEATPEHPRPVPPRRALASLGTHDLAHFAAFVAGDDIDDRLVCRRQDPAATALEQAQRRALVAAWTGRPGDGAPDDEQTRALLVDRLASLSASEAELVVVDLEDLWLEHHPQNRPGTGGELGNWCWRAARTLDQARRDPFVVATLAVVDRARRAGSTAAGPASPPPGARELSA